jgi:DNA-binding CsgD family transcriptional regulator
MHRIQVGGLVDVEGRPQVAPLALVRDGHVSDALAAAERLLARPGLGDEDRALLLAAAQECRLARGDVGDALALGDRLAAYHRLPGRTGAVAQHAAGELSSALNEVEAAARYYAAAGALLPAGAADAQLVPWRVGAAVSAVRLGRRGEGAALAREQLQLAAGAPAATALALRTLAATEAGGGRETLLRRATEALAPSRYGRLAAQVDTDLAGLLLLPGEASAHRVESIALLRRAEEYAGRHQLWPLQTRVRGLLDRAGEAPRRGAQEMLATLTAAERRVTTLAAEGLTNRTIAARLDLTVKAVEWHLSHVYRKLGIRSRAGLAPTLAAAEPGVPA